MVIGVTGDKFIAIYNVSGTMCVFEQPASGVTDGKAYLGKSGKEVKEAWPELELPPSVFAAVLVTDSKSGHFILFQVTPRPHRHLDTRRRELSLLRRPVWAMVHHRATSSSMLTIRRW